MSSNPFKLRQPPSVLQFGLPPEQVDRRYDPRPLVANGSYCQIWLVEAQWSVGQASDRTWVPFIFSNVRFVYGHQTIAVPRMVRLAGSNKFTGAYRLNTPITPLFPYRGGQIELTMGMHCIRTSNDIEASVQTLVDLSDLFSLPEISKFVPVGEVLSKGVERLLAGREAELVLGVAQTFGPDGGSEMSLRPGYFGVLRADLPGFEYRDLCVVDESLRTRSDRNSDSQSLASSVSASLLFRIEKVESRDDWSALPRTNIMLRQAYEQLLQGEEDASQQTFRQLVVDILRNDDLTATDRRRLVDAVKNSLADLRADIGTVSPGAVSSAAVVRQVNANVEKIVREEEEVRRSAERFAATAPYRTASDELVLSIECDLNEPVRMKVIGELYEGRTGDKILRLDPGKLARQADLAFSGDWRPLTKGQGEELFQKVFGDPVISDFYNRWLGRIDSEGLRLHIRLRTSRELLLVPFEHLFSKAHRDYLVLEHPLARTVTGEDVTIHSGPLSPRFLTKQYEEGKSLSFLLIASDTPPDLARVDEEIQALAEALPKFFSERNISVHVKTLPTDQATYEAVRQELVSTDYHVIHYAGHGVHVSDSPEQSYLPFWSEPGRKGIVKQLTMPVLHRALESRKALRFVYLSCCVGTAHAQNAQLLTNDFLGIADSLIQASVPSILGFRWPVLDSGAKNLALAFYRYLAQTGQIDTALLLARKELAEDRTSHTWLSPILILQS